MTDRQVEIVNMPRKKRQRHAIELTKKTGRKIESGALIRTQNCMEGKSYKALIKIYIHFLRQTYILTFSAISF